MSNILYIVAALLLVGWALGVFVWDATGMIHLLLILAIISILFRIIRRA